MKETDLASCESLDRLPPILQSGSGKISNAHERLLRKIHAPSTSFRRSQYEMNLSSRSSNRTDFLSFPSNSLHKLHKQRGAHGVILVYDVSKRETFDALKDVWLKEVSMYSTRAAAVKMVVGNKVDIEDRQVSREEGLAFARQQSTLFVESSAKTATGVQQTFEELLRKILETPELCTADSKVGNIRPSASGNSSYAESCSC